MLRCFWGFQFIGFLFGIRPFVVVCPIHFHFGSWIRTASDYLLRPSSFIIHLYQKIFKILERQMFINIWRTIVTLFVTFLVSDARHVCKVIRRTNNNYFISIKFFLAICKISQNLIPAYFGWTLSPWFSTIHRTVYVKHLKHSAYNMYNYINNQNFWIFIPLCKPVKVFHLIQLE